MSSVPRIAKLSSAVVVALAASAAFPSSAKADEVSPTAKGIVGGALLGGEVVVITEAIIGVRDPLPYWIGAGLGMVGGGIGGYAVEQASTDGKAPVYMLAGGLALAIPAIVLTLNATRYRPSEEATEDRAPTNVPPADPGKAGGSSVIGGEAPAAPAGGTPAPAAPPSPPPPTGGGAGGGGTPTSLINLPLAPNMAPGKVQLALPVPEVRPLYSAAERKALGVNQETEVRVPVFHVVF